LSGDSVCQNAPNGTREGRRAHEHGRHEGEARAQWGVGNMYYRGRGVPENYAEAMKWFRLAAEQGEARAQFGLGEMYFAGQGVPENYAEAVKWLRLAAEQGYARAQYKLGLSYYLGWGIPERKDKGNLLFAYLWLSLASGQGFEEAKEPRDEILNSMTPLGISRAQDMARECFENNYKGCGF
jgi:uncharacterized protein